MLSVICGRDNFSQTSTKKLVDLFQRKQELKPFNQDALMALTESLEDVQKLLNLNANPNASFKDSKGNKVPFLSYAAKTGNSKLTKLLLDHGSNPNTRDHKGRSALGLALSSQSISFVSDDRLQERFGEALIQNAKNNLFKRNETVLELLKAGANTKIFHRTKETPIHNIMLGDILGVIIKDQIIDEEKVSNANTNKTYPEPQILQFPKRVFDKKIRFDMNQEEKNLLIQNLIDNGISMNLKDRHGYTPLHLAIMKQDYSLAQNFIKNGAGVNAKSKKGITPLHIAAHKCNKQLVDLLLENGANVSIKDRASRTASDFAVLKNQLDLANYIRAKSMDQTIQEKKSDDVQPNENRHFTKNSTSFLKRSHKGKEEIVFS